MSLIIIAVIAIAVFYAGAAILEYRERWINSMLRDEAIRLAVLVECADAGERE